ncbi:subtype B tannase [uncultured Lactobacillus sp.]|uniref:subtype B tannase n=1 Tax=uncultured Lactobacillus sp. TaxID=153152 RepID=UPI0028052B57|nr:subtype B tannase [uncultured Lactobacillus sp.]
MLDLNAKDYKDQQFTDHGKSFLYRAYMNIPYVERPVSDIQKLNIFIPLAYFQDVSINGYTKETAPIFMPNTVGGYMPGPRDFPENKTFPNNSETIKKALEHGYVVVSAGLRGRTLKDKNGINIGKAPAFAVDMKAAVRYVRHNSDKIPGNTERIITNGTSAGGATSAITGISGNYQFFEKYLDELGAAHESDAVFAASCYCPIHNLEHADSAYEWEFNGINNWKRGELVKPGNPPVFKDITGTLTEEEIKLSQLLKNKFISYLNNLHLKDEKGNELVLDKEGEGSFLDYVKRYIVRSAQIAIDQGAKLTGQEGITVHNHQVETIDWKKYLNFITRMKSVPAFDDLNMKNPEPDLFGDKEVESKHFTNFAQKYSHVASELADPKIVKAINPITYLTEEKADSAKYWRIRHGASDRDTSFAIPIILATLLQNKGYQVDFEIPWGTPHSGDYDLRDLFTWIDRVCAKG